ncbi:MAG: ABC transporter ATP-binding protein [Corynebacterium sp.]|uniref:ABC transporter ATP-binding protein n=1 Tax=unclassified Corynebacterium TaxID=2624378 RepID=UPI000AAB2025|nr:MULTISPECIES: ABC transporter ATP-binding protein [unclassified Corynebacterium]MDU1461420.1 ABC transporter ATP-binding protein [Corynebacterium sp.]MDU5016928.1 ABC transporter ATP-binding protein [Corynebacterium sp.]
MITPNYPPLADDPTSQALAVRGLNKSFAGRPAVSNLSLDIPRGSIYGIVGPNGAGKTTMLTMACGLLRPDSGEAFIAGHNTWQDPLAAKAAMGLLIDGAPVFDRLSGPEFLFYLGALRRMNQMEAEHRSAQLLDALQLADAADKPIADYSAGMTKKILLAGALLHNPEVVILDEPLEAVDPVSGKLIQELLRAYVDRGGTVILSSHVMQLVEGLCDHVAIIAGGQVLSAGHVEEVRQEGSLTDAFIHFAGGGEFDAGSFDWLRRDSDEPQRRGGEF